MLSEVRLAPAPSSRAAERCEHRPGSRCDALLEFASAQLTDDLRTGHGGLLGRGRRSRLLSEEVPKPVHWLPLQCRNYATTTVAPQHLHRPSLMSHCSGAFACQQAWWQMANGHTCKSLTHTEHPRSSDGCKHLFKFPYGGGSCALIRVSREIA